jgi:UDP-2-acetamido-3-amino-2,3-dideoxy-glucuronate N-acetyltransferase
MGGVPARVMGWVCRCGVTLHLQGDDGRCTECERRYRRDGMTLKLIE